MKTKYVAVAALAILLANPMNAMAEGKNGVAAVVNGDRITVAELRKIYDDTPQIHTQEKWDVFYGKALDAWVNSRILLQAANKSDVRKTQEYRKQLEEVSNDLASRMYLKQKVEGEMTENDLKNLYNQYKTNFVAEKEMRARHILVDDEGLANQIIAKIKQGENFDDLAKKYSKEKEDDLGYFTKDMMVPDFGKAAFSMKKGEFSQKPIKTQFGYHIIVVDDIRASQPLSYKDAEPQLKSILAQEILKKVMSDMNKGAKIEKYTLDGQMIK